MQFSIGELRDEKKKNIDDFDGDFSASLLLVDCVCGKLYAVQQQKSKLSFFFTLITKDEKIKNYYSTSSSAFVIHKITFVNIW